MRGHAPVLTLCRKLIAARYDPATRLECYRGDVLALTVRSIGEAAKLVVDEKGLRFAPQKPFSQPKGSPPMRLKTK